LDNPNPDDFLNEEAAKLFKKNREEYNKNVINYTKQYANYDIFKRTLIINENNCF
jgi:ubiquitin-protein ligase